MKITIFLLSLSFYSCQLTGNYNDRSPAQRTPQYCKVSLKNIFELRKKFKPPAYHFKSQKNSLSRKIPNYRDKISKLEGSVPGVRPFVELFLREFGRNPTHREIISYFKSSITTFSKTVEAFYGHDPLVDEMIKQAFNINQLQARYLDLIDEFTESNRPILDRLYTDDDLSLYEAIRSFKSNYYGILGELDVAMRLRGTLAINIHLKENANPANSYARKFSSSLNELIDSKFEELRKFPQHQKQKIIQRYPKLFKENRFHDNEDPVESASMWIKQKEIDILVFDGKIYRFIEVKNLSKSATVSQITRNPKEKKSILEQSQQMKEIIDFLGLSKDVSVEIFFRRGIKQDAADLFTKEGIFVRGINRP